LAGAVATLASKLDWARVAGHPRANWKAVASIGEARLHQWLPRTSQERLSPFRKADKTIRVRLSAIVTWALRATNCKTSILVWPPVILAPLHLRCSRCSPPASCNRYIFLRSPFPSGFSLQSRSKQPKPPALVPDYPPGASKFE
jgi:hypothetical protein